jgi:hypothetical protein
MIELDNDRDRQVAVPLFVHRNIRLLAIRVAKRPSNAPDLPLTLKTAKATVRRFETCMEFFL